MLTSDSTKYIIRIVEKQIIKKQGDINMKDYYKLNKIDFMCLISTWKDELHAKQFRLTDIKTGRIKLQKDIFLKSLKDIYYSNKDLNNLYVTKVYAKIDDDLYKVEPIQ